MAHAFDSFHGMGEPGEHDRDASTGRYKGQYNVGGSESFTRIMDEKGIAPELYRLWEGYIPSCFDGYRGSDNFSLAIVDVDHYEPTVIAVGWVWPRMTLGGYMLLDDSHFGWEQESSKAIFEFLRVCSDFQIVDYYSKHLMLKKVDTEGRRRSTGR